MYTAQSYNSRLDHLNNFEIDKRVAEKYLNKPPRNNVDLGFLNLDMPRYHFKRQDQLPYVRPTMENALLGKNIDAVKKIKKWILILLIK